MSNANEAKLKELAESFAKAHDAINARGGEQNQRKEPNEPQETEGCA